MTDFDTLSQIQAAKLLGVTPRWLRQLDAEPNPPPRTDNGRYPLAEYGAWLRLKALEGVSVADDGTVRDLDTERARLTAEQADNYALKNAQLRRELAPIATLELVLGKAAGQIRPLLESLPVKIKRRLPAMSAAEVDIMKREIAKCCNAISQLKIDTGDTTREV